MSEIKTPLKTIVRADGDLEYLIQVKNTYMDVLRWLKEQLGDWEDIEILVKLERQKDGTVQP